MSTTPPSPSSAFAALFERVRQASYTPVAALEIVAWLTPEPVTFDQRMSGQKSPLRIGESWSSRVFDCAWMQFRGRVSGDTAHQPLAVRIDISGELCLVDDEGVPVRGLTCVKSSHDVRLGPAGKTVYRLPAASIRDGVVELWGDAALNDLFGLVVDGGRITQAEICTWREDLRQLGFDLEVLLDFLDGLPAADATTDRLKSDLTSLSHSLEGLTADEVSRARAKLRPWFESADKPRLQVHAIGHGHLDLAWLWPIRETIRKGARTLSTALYNRGFYPEYVFGCSQPQLYVWLRENYPDLYRRIHHAVREGAIEPQGTFWVEPDCNLPSGESLVRQILHGAKFFRDEFGAEPDYCWQPDVFGYNGQLPQILRRSGHRYFLTQKLSWNLVNRFPHHSFHWEGIDGSAILAHMLPEETYNGPAAPRSLRKIGEQYAERAVSDDALMAFGMGDGGGGPDAEHLERLRRASGLPGLPAVRVGPTTEFFAEWSQQAAAFPRWKGELYLERHQGTLTTQGRIKRYNRHAEVLLREVEWSAFLAHQRAGVPWPAAQLDRLWKEILLYQFHDILPGSSIKRVYDECYARYEIILAELRQLRDAGYAAVAAAMGGGAPVAFNSLSWPRREWIRHAAGWRWIDVPALGCAQPASVTPPFAPPVATESRLENEFLRVDFASDGSIAGIHDKRARREVLAPGENGNRFAIIPDLGNPWDYEADNAKRDPWLYLQRPAQFPARCGAQPSVDGPCGRLEQTWTFGRSRIRQTVTLFAGSGRLDFSTEVDWHERRTMLRVRFPVAVASDNACFEIPFGSIHRSTREDTSERRAQLEVAMLQWLDLSASDYGVALLNDCKHGARVKGHVIDLALIRSVPFHGSPTFDEDDADSPTPRRACGDLGRHQFSYALLPHAGPGDPVALTRAAREFNTPLFVADATGAVSRGGEMTLPVSAFTCSDAAIELAAIKRTEDGADWAMRLVNLRAHPVSIRFAFSASEAALHACDLREREASPLARNADGSVSLDFGPHEIKTVRWTD